MNLLTLILFSAALDELKIPISELLEPTDGLTANPTLQLTESSVREAAEKTITKFVELSLPGLDDNKELR